ncbi:MAG: hypothetical protein KatS3mg015_2809 [Fimbriimonadales bacterium]|nr:MAG: hypothetical protein KatS3mg015_2809 [Fimbriimonadales bacterium]
MDLRVIAEDRDKITLGWDPVPGCIGYRFQSSTSAPKWSHTWDPMRSRVTFARADWYRVEALGVEASAQYPSPPSPLLVLRLPAKFHIWGGNEQAKMAECDLVVAAFTSNADPRLARQTNPGLIAVANPSLDTWQQDWRLRRGFSWTYGGGLQSWQGVEDSLDPHPQGPIRGFTESDKGCRQADGIQGFALHRPDTARLVAQASFYALKLGRFRERGYDGVWSDNVFPGNLLTAGWVYGSCGASISASAWDEGLLSIVRYLRTHASPLLLGGNVVYRAASTALRAETTMALRENLDLVVSQGVDAVWSDVQQMYAWASTPSVDGLPKVIAVNDRVQRADTDRQRLGLALALIYGGAYAAYDGSHTNTYWPPEIEPRGRLGQPIGPPQRNGSVLSRAYSAGVVSVDLATRRVEIP